MFKFPPFWTIKVNLLKHKYYTLFHLCWILYFLNFYSLFQPPDIVDSCCHLIIFIVIFLFDFLTFLFYFSFLLFNLLLDIVDGCCQFIISTKLCFQSLQQNNLYFNTCWKYVTNNWVYISPSPTWRKCRAGPRCIRTSTVPTDSIVRSTTSRAIHW